MKSIIINLLLNARRLSQSVGRLCFGDNHASAKNKIYKLIKKYLAYYSNVYIILPRGLVAQWLERSAHNALVVGSSPT